MVVFLRVLFLKLSKNSYHLVTIFVTIFRLSKIIQKKNAKNARLNYVKKNQQNLFGIILW